jgi:hypothetical protein
MYENYNKGCNTIYHKGIKKHLPVIFYHFQSITYISRNEIGTSIITNNSLDYKTVDDFYFDYLSKIEFCKKKLESKYNISYLIKRHPSSVNKKPGFKQWLKSFKVVRRIKKTICPMNKQYMIYLDEKI